MEPVNRVGALRATNNKGLQPAIDFILEHLDEAVPVDISPLEATSSVEPIDVDDEDTVLHGTGPGAAAQAASDAGVEATRVSGKRARKRVRKFRGQRRGSL